jgi:hypothetical protein
MLRAIDAAAFRHADAWAAIAAAFIFSMPRFSLLISFFDAAWYYCSPAIRHYDAIDSAIIAYAMMLRHDR